MNSNIKILPRPDPTFTLFSPPFNCPFYFHVSNAEENIACQDPIIGAGEPEKVVQKLCQFSDIPSSPAGPTGGILTYKCVGSQWKVKRNDCIFAPINSLLQLAKVILNILTLGSWWGNLSSLSYFLAVRKVFANILVIYLFPKKMQPYWKCLKKFA